MSSGTDSDEDLPDPTRLFDRLLATPRKQVSSSINNQQTSSTSIFARPEPNAMISSAISKEVERSERRSSPRLRETRQSTTPLISDSLADTTPGRAGARSPLRIATTGLPEEERRKHVELANELFPPSPPSSEPTSSRTAREGTIISDSEPERDFRSQVKTPRRRPRTSVTFILDDEDDKADLSEDRNSRERGTGGRELRDSLVESLNLLSLAPQPTLEVPSASRSKSPTFLSPNPSTPKASRRQVENPILETPSGERDSGRATRKEKTNARSRRRITISVLSSSDSSEDDEPRTGKRRSQGIPAHHRNHTPAKTAGRTGNTLEEGEIMVVETDDEEEPGAEAPDREDTSPLSILNPLIGMEGGGGTKSYKGMDDVWENDGVLIYEPTPRKRPTKLSMKKQDASPSKRTHARRSEADSPTRPEDSLVQALKTEGRVEIDLTGSSSEEEGGGDKHERNEFRLPLPKAANPFSTSSSSPFTPTSTFKTPFPPSPAPRRSPTKSRGTSPSKSAGPPPQTPKTKSRQTSYSSTSSTSTSSRRILTASDRTQLPLSLIRQLDRKVFRKSWSGLCCLDKEGEFTGDGLPEGLEVVWSNRLRNTAGRARWKKIKSPSTVAGGGGGSTSSGAPTVRHECTIELATKVTDTEPKLRNTLAHELCHIAAWVLSNEIKPPHGGAFKLWAARIMQVVPDIEITTTHSYQIEYKYRWQCTSNSCGKIFGRHSKSIDPTTHGCPCGSKLVQIDKLGNPKAAETVLKENERGEMVETPVKKKKSEWLEFVATQSPRVRKEKPEIAQSEVLRVVAERWKVVKEERQRQQLLGKNSLEGDEENGLASAMRSLTV